MPRIALLQNYLKVQDRWARVIFVPRILDWHRYMPTDTASRRLKQDCEFEASLSYKEISRPVWARQTLSRWEGEKLVCWRREELRHKQV